MIQYCVSVVSSFTILYVPYGCVTHLFHIQNVFLTPIKIWWAALLTVLVELQYNYNCDFKIAILILHKIVLCYEIGTFTISAQSDQV